MIVPLATLQWRGLGDAARPSVSGGFPWRLPIAPASAIVAGGRGRREAAQRTEERGSHARSNNTRVGGVDGPGAGGAGRADGGVLVPGPRRVAIGGSHARRSCVGGSRGP